LGPLPRCASPLATLAPGSAWSSEPAARTPETSANRARPLTVSSEAVTAKPEPLERTGSSPPEASSGALPV